MSVRSNVLGETLGRILLDKRLISSEVLAESVRRMQKEKRHQGEILVEMGALSPFNLERALVEQLEAKLFEMFSWTDGKFMFKAGDAPAGENRLLERSPAATILEGIRRHYDERARTRCWTSTAASTSALTSDPMLRLQDMTSRCRRAGVHPEHRRQQAARGGSLERAEIPRDKARLLLVALSEAGMLQRHETTTRRKGAAAGRAPPVSSMPVLGRARRRRRRRPRRSRAASSSMMLQTVRTQDYFWALDVGRDAPAADIDRAYEALARSFHADRYRLSPEEDRRAAQGIFEQADRGAPHAARSGQAARATSPS